MCKIDKLETYGGGALKSRTLQVTLEVVPTLVYLPNN